MSVFRSLLMQQDVYDTIYGTNSITFNAKANGLNYLKLFGGTEQRSKLPEGYTQLSYVNIPANSYLTTDINPTYDGRYEFDFQTTTLSSGGATTYLGVRPASSGNGGLRVARISSKVFRIYGFGTYQDSTTTVTSDTRYKFVWNNQHAVMTSGGDTVLDLTYTDTGDCVYPITINGWNSAGSVTPGSEAIFVYSFKAWNTQGELVADYVPAKDANEVVGFYDMVSESFKTATSGTFEAGAVVTPTPDMPMNIVSNNGVIKYSLNMANVNAQTALVGYYISTSGVVTASTQNWIYQDYIPVEPNTTYTLTMSSSIYFVSISEYSTADDSGFIRRNIGSTGDNTTLTIITGSTTNFVRFGTNIDGSSSATLERVLAINWMLNEGNSMPYTPYSPTGIYTDGTVETVEVTGKNLYNKENGVLFGYPTGSYTWYQKTDATSELTIMVRLKEGSTYTATRAAGATAVFRIQASATPTLTSGQSLVDIDSTGTSAATTKTFTVPYGAPYVLFYVRNTSAQSSLTVNDVINAFQVEQGSTATEYEPYFNGGQATAEMLLKVGSYQDIQSVLDGNVTRKVGIKVLDGTEDWTYSSSRFRLNITDYLVGSSIMATTISHYNLPTMYTGAIANGEARFGKQGADSTVSNSNMLIIHDDNYTSLDSYKAFLADQYANGTPVIVVYPLATPTTETVAGQHLTTQAGTNTISITQASISSLDLEAKYKRSR